MGCFGFFISIHALLAESDEPITHLRLKILISIHALLAESDRKRHSTRYISSHISIHALLAESDAQFIGADAYLAENISIHALLAESDSSIEEVSKYVVISIHALLAESDVFRFAWLAPGAYFYPRSPCGERPVGVIPVILII